jgi:hypothetical protein
MISVWEYYKKMVTTGYSYKGLIKGKMVIEQTN